MSIAGTPATELPSKNPVQETLKVGVRLFHNVDTARFGTPEEGVHLVDEAVPVYYTGSGKDSPEERTETRQAIPP